MEDKAEKKRLHEIIYGRAVGASKRFREEFKAQVFIAISAAVGFLIALSWREPISKLINSLIVKLGLQQQVIYYEFLSAIIITIIAVLILIIIAKWNEKKP